MHVVRVVLAPVAILALSATVAFADRDEAPPAAATFGLNTATNASGHEVPVRANEAPADLDGIEEEAPAEVAVEDGESVDAVEELASDAELAQEGESHCIDPAAEVDPTVDGEEPNHGAIVCGAARFGDWEAAGCENHGQYVRTFANKNFEGEPGECEATDAADADESAAEELETTLETGEAAAGPGSNGNGRGQGNGNGANGGNGRGNGRP
jgi:hypothetical protein